MTTFDSPVSQSSRRSGWTVWLIAGTLGVFLLWANFAWVDEIVRAPGQVVPSSRPQIIQNLEGGILAELTVAEGDVVEAGQTLARLQGTQYQASVDDLTDQIAALDIRRLRLEAEGTGTDGFAVPEDEAARVPKAEADRRAADLIKANLHLIRRGQGSLVASVYGSDHAALAQAALQLTDSHGRVHVISPDVAALHTGHGNVMPQSLHGGPGRAGGGDRPCRALGRCPSGPAGSDP